MDVNSIWGGFTIGGVSLHQMLWNLTQNLPALAAAIFGFCYVAGFWLVFKAIYKLKQYGELRTMMSSNTDLREPIMMFVGAAFLIYAPTGINVLEHTFFWNYTATPLGYNVNSSAQEWTFIEGVAMELIRFAGLIAFIKGVLIISHLGSQSMGQNTLGKAMTFLIGGIMCLNIKGLIAILASTFGLLAS